MIGVALKTLLVSSRGVDQVPDTEPAWRHPTRGFLRWLQEVEVEG